MAYQPKSYRKFVATAATATLVASAVAPLASAASFTDVKESYKEAVDFVVSKGALGLTPTQFGVDKEIKRVDAAVLLAQVLGLDTANAPASGFTDVPARAEKYVGALKAAGITNGKTATSFGAQDNIKRGELALMIAKGFGLSGKAELKFTDVSSRYTEAVEALVANKITNGTSPTQFGTEKTAKRGDYAKFLFAASKVKGGEVDAAVAGIKAINATTVEVTYKEAIKDINSMKYTIEGLTVSNAVVKQTDSKVAVLTTSAQEGGKKYTVKSGDKTLGQFDGISAVIPTTISLVSTSEQAKVGNQVTLKADIGQKTAGVPVTFNVAPNGTLNKAQVEEVYTDANGIATYSYTQYNAGEDFVAAYPTGDAKIRGNAKVFWGVKDILTVATDDKATSNGQAKTYTVTYLDPATGTPLVGKELNVTFLENIDGTVNNDSTATLTDPTTGANEKPYEAVGSQRVLTVKTNSKGQATFTVTGSNTSATPVVYADTNAVNNRLDPMELKFVAPTVKFAGAVYTYEFDKKEQFSGVFGEKNAATYTVTVKKADGTPYAGGTASVNLWENIDGSIATNTDAKILESATVTAIGNTGSYKVSLDDKGQAKFKVYAPDRYTNTQVSATPVVWVDLNNAGNQQGILEKEEAYQLAGTVVFQNEQIQSAALDDAGTGYGAYTTDNALGQPDYAIDILNQAGNAYAQNYKIDRVTYTINNTGNSAVKLNLVPTNFTVDSISNNNGSTNLNNVSIAAGQSITVTGSATTANKGVSLGTNLAIEGKQTSAQLTVTGSGSVKYGTNLGYIENYSAGSKTTDWYVAEESDKEVTGVVKGYRTADLENAWGYALLEVDGGGYKYVKYSNAQEFYSGTQDNFGNLTKITADQFEAAISVNDRLSLKNGEIRLVNVDKSYASSQISGNKVDTVVTKTELKKALDASKAVKKEDYTEESYAKLKEATDAANLVYDNTSAKQANVDAATKAVNDAIKALVAVPVEGIKITSSTGTAPNSAYDFLGTVAYQVEGTVADAYKGKELKLEFSNTKDSSEKATEKVTVGADGKFSHSVPASDMLGTFDTVKATITVDGKTVESNTSSIVITVK